MGRRYPHVLRVLMVGALYPPHYQGGYEVVWQSFAQHMRTQGHRVRVLCTDVRMSGVPLDAPEDEDVYRELDWRLHGYAPALGRFARYRRERHNAVVFVRHLEEMQPDLVMWWHMFGVSLGLLEQGRRRGPPALAVAHDEWPLYGPNHDVWVTTWRARPLSRAVVTRLTRLPAQIDVMGTATWSFNSQWLRDRVLCQAGKPARDLTSVVSPGIAPRLFREASVRDWSGRLAYVGRIDERKGIGVAIDALEHLPGATLTVTGGGDDNHLTELRLRAAERHVSNRVTFAPAVPRDRLAEVYTAADVVLFPVTWHEPWGLVPLEAMAVGRPVIATGTGGSAEYLRDGENALLVEPGDSQALGRAVQRLAREPGLRERLRAGGLRTAARHDESTFLDGLEREAERVATAR